MNIAMGTLVSLIERAADILAPVDGVHSKDLLRGAWMATDGTGLKVAHPWPGDRAQRLRRDVPA